MNVTIKVEKTFSVEMTHDQARNLLDIAVAAEKGMIKLLPSPNETLNALRQALLSAGVYLTDEKDKPNAAN